MLPGPGRGLPRSLRSVTFNSQKSETNDMNTETEQLISRMDSADVPGIKVKLAWITPDLAMALLKFNDGNREIRRSLLRQLADAYEDGHWQLTHQGLCFSETGRLLDGQHRLTVISRLPEGTRVRMFLMYGFPETAFEAIDQGARRSAADALRISTSLASVAQFYSRIINNDHSGLKSSNYIRPYVEWVEEVHDLLISEAPQKQILFSSAAMRSAACYQMMRGHDREYVVQTYRSLIYLDYDNMPQAAKTMDRQVRKERGQISARGLDLFCRGLRVFDSHRRHERIAKLVVRDQSAQIAEVRKHLLERVLGQKKSPAPVGPDSKDRKTKQGDISIARRSRPVLEPLLL